MFMRKMRAVLIGAFAGVFAAAGIAAAPFSALAAEGEMGALARIYVNETGWSDFIKDNTYGQAPQGSYVTAMQVTLENQPAGTAGTIAYQVNLSGSGWLDWQENFEEAGTTADTMPLEAIRVKLTGELAETYDLYYSVFQSGVWTDLVMNGDTAGTEGCGRRVDGIRIAVRAKDAGAPEEPVNANRIDLSKPMIALTFDDGPSASTPRILDSLEANGGRATFYMVGNRMAGCPDTVRRMVSLGCEAGCHTWGHTYLTKMSADGISQDLARFNAELESIAGVRCRTMRPPGGYINSASKQALGACGMPAVMWSIDTLDWKTRNAQSTIDCVLSQVRDGDIILMHDLYGTSADAAVVLIPELISRGYQLVTVSELAEYRGGIQPGQSYSQFR